MPKNVDDLVLEEGIEIPDDPLEIERMLEEEEAAAEPDKGTKGKEGEQPAKPGTETGDAGKPGDDEAQQQQAADQSKGKPEEREEAPGPPQAVLRRERENRHKAETLLAEREQEVDRLKSEREALEAKVAELSKGGSKQEIRDAKQELQDLSASIDTDVAAIERLRSDLDDDAVNALKKTPKQVADLRQENADLRQRVERLEGVHGKQETDERQDDIDSAPLLAVIQATRSKEADALWGRAVAYEKALQSDPDWADKSRGEIYQEIDRRLHAHLGDAAAIWLAVDTEQQPAKGGADKGKPAAQPDKGKGSDRGKTVEDKLAAARARATPDSLSDLPTGIAAAQHEVERLEAMSIPDVEDLLNKAMDKGNLDEVLQRLTSATR